MTDGDEPFYGIVVLGDILKEGGQITDLHLT